MKYRNPPITEALCDFRFVPGQDEQEVLVPGLVHERVKTDFPISKVVKVLEQQTSAEPGNVRTKIVSSDRVQFRQADNLALIQVGKGLLSVHRLKPYPGWSLFFPKIRHGLEVYTAVASPKQLESKSLRYINRFELKKDDRIEDFLEFRPSLGPAIQERLSSFRMAVDLPEDGENPGALRIETGTTEEIPGRVGILLDIRCTANIKSPVILADILEWLKLAHAKVAMAFESCVTDRMRERLNAAE